MPDINGLELLKSRRSIRSFDSRPIADSVLNEIFEATRWCFSAVNRQPWSFIVIRNRELIQRIARECTTGQFASHAPVLVAIIGDTKVQPEWYLHDTCFVSLQLALAAWAFGVGTCWIGVMNKDNIKKLLKLEQKDFLLTILPLGYPKGILSGKQARKSLQELITYVD